MQYKMRCPNVSLLPDVLKDGSFFSPQFMDNQKSAEKSPRKHRKTGNFSMVQDIEEEVEEEEEEEEEEIEEDVTNDPDWMQGHTPSCIGSSRRTMKIEHSSLLQIPSVVTSCIEEKETNDSNSGKLPCCSCTGKCKNRRCRCFAVSGQCSTRCSCAISKCMNRSLSEQSTMNATFEVASETEMVDDQSTSTPNVTVEDVSAKSLAESNTNEPHPPSRKSKERRSDNITTENADPDYKKFAKKKRKLGVAGGTFFGDQV